MYRLKPASQSSLSVPTLKGNLVISSRMLRDQSRRWHQKHPEFAMDILKDLGHCRNAAEEANALHWHSEALSIGFWCKKDVVQYPVACIHAKGGLISVPSFCQFLDQFTEQDEDIMQKLLDIAPVHYWTYLSQKTHEARSDR